MHNKTDATATTDRTLKVTVAISLIAVTLITIYGWTVIPADAEIPTHWNASGQVDSTMGKTGGLLIAPLVVALMGALFLVIPRVEPRRANLAKSAGAYRVTVGAIMALMVGMQAIVVATAAGAALDVSLIVSCAVGLLFMIIGNQLGKVRSNFMFGVRLPWTLASEKSWLHTNRFAGWGFFVTGLATLTGAVVAGGPAAMAIMLAGLGVTLVGCVVVAYRAYRSDPAVKANEE